MTIAGKLDHRIVIIRSTTSPNDYNEPIGVWTDFVSVRAGYDPVSDGERYRAGETLANRKGRFTIRYSSDVSSVDPRDRVRFDGREWDIDGVKRAGKRGELIEITATARAENL